MASEGASANERLLAAAKEDNEEMILELFQHPGSYDINFQDGLGNTALHYASQFGSTDVLEHILEQEGCDVDLQNRLDRSTPLHLAVKIADDELRNYVVQSLLEAGANSKMKNKYSQTPQDLLAPKDDETRKVFRRAEAEAQLAAEEVVDDDGFEEGASDEED